MITARDSLLTRGPFFWGGKLFFFFGGRVALAEDTAALRIR